jgi:alpha-N-acetylglucosaminidase
MYNADPFNEELPPSNDPKYLANVGKAIYQSMKSADPKAIWILQGWFLLHTGRFWQPPQTKALLNAIPSDRLVILDLWAEVHPMWKRSDKFYNHSFIWCMLHNFGGRPGLYGKLPTISRDIVNAKKESGSLMKGIGLSMEAIDNNPIVYDLVTDMTWRSGAVNIDEWVSDYTHRRYGALNENAQKAWALLQKSVYDCHTTQMSGTGAVFAARPAFDIHSVSAGPLQLFFDPKDVKNAWKLLLTCDQFSELETYRYDLVDITVQILTIIGNNLYYKLADAYRKNDAAAFKKAADDMRTVMRDMDDMLQTNVNFLLGRWTSSARAWGSTTDEINLMEKNARLQITSWGEPSNEVLLQYAYKLWSGLVTDFYLPRWEIFFDFGTQSVENSKHFDYMGYEVKVVEFETQWVNGMKEFPTEPTGDTFKMSKKLYQKYSDVDL